MSTSTILSDNGVSSGTSGIKTSGGNDGTLVLQTTTAGGAATTAVTIDTTQKVGIGTTSPARQLTVYETDTPIIALQNSTTGTTVNDGTIFYVSGSDAAIKNKEATGGILFHTGGDTERMRILAGAPILCLSGGSTSATGTGIAFPATQSASSNVNTLDDYEEGEWTPIYVTGGGSVSYGTRNGNYVKIGQYVYCRFEIILTGITSPTGSLALGGLPFTSQNSRYPGSLTLGYSVFWNANLNPVAGYVLKNDTTVNLCTYALASGMAEIDSTALASGTSKNYLVGSICYITST